MQSDGEETNTAVGIIQMVMLLYNMLFMWHIDDADSDNEGSIIAPPYSPVLYDDDNDG